MTAAQLYKIILAQASPALQSFLKRRKKDVMPLFSQAAKAIREKKKQKAPGRARKVKAKAAKMADLFAFAPHPKGASIHEIAWYPASKFPGWLTPPNASGVLIVTNGHIAGFLPTSESPGKVKSWTWPDLGVTTARKAAQRYGKLSPDAFVAKIGDLPGTGAFPQIEQIVKQSAFPLKASAPIDAATILAMIRRLPVKKTQPSYFLVRGAKIQEDMKRYQTLPQGFYAVGAGTSLADLGPGARIKQDFLDYPPSSINTAGFDLKYVQEVFKRFAPLAEGGNAILTITGALAPALVKFGPPGSPAAAALMMPYRMEEFAEAFLALPLFDPKAPKAPSRARAPRPQGVTMAPLLQTSVYEGYRPGLEGVGFFAAASLPPWVTVHAQGVLATTDGHRLTLVSVDRAPASGVSQYFSWEMLVPNEKITKTTINKKFGKMTPEAFLDVALQAGPTPGEAFPDIGSVIPSDAPTQALPLIKFTKALAPYSINRMGSTVLFQEDTLRITRAKTKKPVPGLGLRALVTGPVLKWPHFPDTGMRFSGRYFLDALKAVSQVKGGTATIGMRKELDPVVFQSTTLSETVTVVLMPMRFDGGSDAKKLTYDPIIEVFWSSKLALNAKGSYDLKGVPYKIEIRTSAPVDVKTSLGGTMKKHRVYVEAETPGLKRLREIAYFEEPPGKNALRRIKEEATEHVERVIGKEFNGTSQRKNRRR